MSLICRDSILTNVPGIFLVGNVLDCLQLAKQSVILCHEYLLPGFGNDCESCGHSIAD